MTKLYAEVYEHANFRGQRRWLAEDLYDFSYQGFNDKVSSIKVKRAKTIRLATS